MANFSNHIEALLDKEGRVMTNDPTDLGGLTYWGISRVHNPNWQGWTYIDHDKEVPIDLVHEYYKQNYWDPLKLDEIPSEQLAELLLSCSVLSGPRTAGRLLQIALEITPDGIVGPKTLKKVSETNYEIVILRMTLARIARFCEIVHKKPSQIKYLKGWIRRVLNEVI